MRRGGDSLSRQLLLKLRSSTGSPPVAAPPSNLLFLISTFYYSCKLIILYYINHEEGGRFAFASTSAEVALKYGLAASRGSAFESPFLISTFYYSCKLIILYYINHEEGGRFELPVGLSPQQFSRLPHSTALASLLNI